MKVVTIPCNFDNYSYLLVCPETGAAAVVDPAEYYPVVAAMEREKVRLEAILCTHHHADHIGGLDDLLVEFPGVGVFAHAKDLGRIAAMDNPVEDGSVIRFGNQKGRVLYTPGHTSGSICYLFGEKLFAGDTLFGAGCGRLFEGSYEQLYNGLNHSIATLPGETEIYFGHEYTLQNLKFAAFVDPDNREVEARLRATETARKSNLPTSPSKLSLECATNPFLRCEAESLIAQIGGRIPAEGKSPLDLFSALRRLKDGFS